MAQIRRRTQNVSSNVKHSSNLSKLSTYLHKIKNRYSIKSILFDPKLSWISMILLFLFEIILNIFIINRINYTEIDWTTYMQQVQCFLNGTIDYKSISGDTGSLVYPAGHLYAYTILYFVTNGGTNITVAQYIFAFIYLVTLIAVFRIYSKCAALPPYAFVFMCCTSYRIHSIYVLRLFNDTIAITLLYIAINLFIDRKWTLGCFIYSFAVSVKMNILLFAPALLLLLLETNSKKRVIMNLAVCAIVQILLGMPFLITHPLSYINGSFNIGRVFMHKWTVNWRFVSNDIFISHYFHIILLVCHLATLLVFFKHRFNFNKWLPTKKTTSGLLSNEQILLTLFAANFIGISFSRSLHYQFYVWYFHSLPFLLWRTSYEPKTKLCILGLIELVWNTYPSTNWSSCLLHFLHALIFVSLWKNRAFNTVNANTVSKSK